mgnify:CR=1 FL=1
MTASYPATVKTFTSKVDLVDTVFAAHVNDLQDEVNALEASIGAGIKTSSGWVGSLDTTTTTWSTLRARIDNIEYGITTALDRSLPSGGTTNQVLVKSSNSNYAVAWSSTISGYVSQTNGTVSSASTSSGVVRNIYVSTSSPSGGSDGDVWLKYV